MREIKTVIVELEYPRDDCLRDCSDEYYGIGRELIRCKECKHWACDDSESYCDELGIFGTSPTSYCSFAKREEE